MSQNSLTMIYSRQPLINSSPPLIHSTPPLILSTPPLIHNNLIPIYNSPPLVCSRQTDPQYAATNLQQPETDPQ